MTDLLQPDLFGQLPAEPVDPAVLRTEYAQAAAKGAREKPFSEQEARDQKILASRDEDLSREQKGPSLSLALEATATEPEVETTTPTYQESLKLARKGIERARRPTLFDPDSYIVPHE